MAITLKARHVGGLLDSNAIKLKPFESKAFKSLEFHF